MSERRVLVIDLRCGDLGRLREEPVPVLATRSRGPHVEQDRVPALSLLRAGRPHEDLGPEVAMPLVGQRRPVFVLGLVVARRRRVDAEPLDVVGVEMGPDVGVDLVPRCQPVLAPVAVRLLPPADREHMPVGHPASDHGGRIGRLRAVEKQGDRLTVGEDLVGSGVGIELAGIDPRRLRRREGVEVEPDRVGGSGAKILSFVTDPLVVRPRRIRVRLSDTELKLFLDVEAKMGAASRES